jgi:hypothetical protein
MTITNISPPAPGRVVDLMRMLKVPVHTRCNVPVIVLKRPTTTTTFSPTHFSPSIRTENEIENEDENCVGVSDSENFIDKNDTLKSCTEQIICIPPYVTQEHSAEHSAEHSHGSAKDLISIEVIFHGKK